MTIVRVTRERQHTEEARGVDFQTKKKYVREVAIQGKRRASRAQHGSPGRAFRRATIGHARAGCVWKSTPEFGRGLFKLIPLTKVQLGHRYRSVNMPPETRASCLGPPDRGRQSDAPYPSRGQTSDPSLSLGASLNVTPVLVTRTRCRC